MPDITPGVGIYAILDNKAQSIVGMLMLHKHIATALRMYNAIMSDPQSMAARHPQDFDLIHLGWVSETNGLIPVEGAPHDIIQTGAHWLSQQQENR